MNIKQRKIPNRPFPSCPLPHFQNESSGETMSNENEFVLHENGRTGESHFHMNGVARRLVLTERQRVTRK